MVLLVKDQWLCDVCIFDPTVQCVSFLRFVLLVFTESVCVRVVCVWDVVSFLFTLDQTFFKFRG